MSRRGARTQTCGEADARRRLGHARQFLDVAELAADDHAEDGSLEYGNAAATLAVLAGIAAADAACCKALGQRPRGDDHRQATALVASIAGVGDEAARELTALIAIKNDAQYGFYAIGPNELTRVLRKARRLVELAERVVAR